MTLVTSDTIEKWSKLKESSDERGVKVFPKEGAWVVRVRSLDGTETLKRETLYAGTRLYRRFKTKIAAETFAKNLRLYLANNL